MNMSPTKQVLLEQGMARLVRLAGEDFRQMFEAQGIEFEVSVTDTALHSYVDQTRIAQIAGNLLQNAAKFTPKGGRVTLALHASENGKAIISVRDDGAGLSPEMLGSIFEPLVQDSRTIHHSQGGLALGLALVKGLLELHGDGPGRGATFIVSLPVE